MKELKNSGGARRGRRNFWRQSRDWKLLSSRPIFCQHLSTTTLRALVKRFGGLREEAVVRDPHADEQFVATSNLMLNPEQLFALKETPTLGYRRARVGCCTGDR
jgi:hypothetical protein